ncbi:MAG: CotH kinase family protein, partial [Rudanella sp.]|nr:CotH kinase family protein [Rudanella sp.]
MINTGGQAIPNEPKIVASFSLIANESGKRNTVTDAPVYSGKIGIEQRGSTSRQLFPKKPYGIELRDPTGQTSVNVSLLGMPAESDWVMNAVYNDKTLVREALTYDLNRKMSSVYTPRFRYCELMLNGKYEGIYILFEKIKRDKNRIDMATLKKTDISGDELTGGYLLKVDKSEGSPSRSWTSPQKNINGKAAIIQIDRPKPEDLAEEQFQYIKKYVTDFENALAGVNFQDPATGYRKYVDELSVIDYVLITEICRNVDGYRLSTYFYKDKDSNRMAGAGGKLVMGPIWDYNLAYGNADYCDGNKSEGWEYNFNRVCPTDNFAQPFWWERFLQDPDFTNKLSLRYKAL